MWLAVREESTNCFWNPALFSNFQKPILSKYGKLRLLLSKCPDIGRFFPRTLCTTLYFVARMANFTPAEKHQVGGQELKFPYINGSQYSAMYEPSTGIYLPSSH
jgi:hypothetical protein